jgi:hypothetical protein
MSNHKYAFTFALGVMVWAPQGGMPTGHPFSRPGLVRY